MREPCPSPVPLERADVLAFESAGHSGLRWFMPGQFAWLTLRRSPFFVSEHPFSIASAPEVLPRIEFGIKALGDFTGTVSRLYPGEIAYLDGPYGVFSIDRHKTAPGLVGIAGGIGITPLISMLRSLAARHDPRPVWLFYANKNLQEAVYRDELDRLSERLNLTLVDVLEQAPKNWIGETGFVREDVLDRHLPRAQRTDLHYFLCGPPPMTKAAEDALHAFGVPAHRIHTEIFALV